MKIQNMVSEILLKEWDPMGVKNLPEAQGEYDGYALKIVGMLYNNEGETKIAQYLNEVVTKDLELPVNESLAKTVSKKILTLPLERPYKK